MADEQNIPLSVLRSYSPHPDKLDLTGLTQEEITHGIKSSKLPDYIRYKQYLTDTNEALAQLAEMIIQFAVNLGLDPDQTMAWARKLQQAVPQSEFDSWIATLLDGGPSIYMNTLSELQTTYPNGAAGVALVRETDPAKIYVWNGSTWEDFGDYQGIEIKDDAVTTPKIADNAVTTGKTDFIVHDDTVNLFDGSFTKGYIGGSASQGFSIYKTQFPNQSYIVREIEPETSYSIQIIGASTSKVITSNTLIDSGSMVGASVMYEGANLSTPKTISTPQNANYIYIQPGGSQDNGSESYVKLLKSKVPISAKPGESYRFKFKMDVVSKNEDVTLYGERKVYNKIKLSDYRDVSRDENIYQASGGIIKSGSTTAYTALKPIEVSGNSVIRGTYRNLLFADKSGQIIPDSFKDNSGYLLSDVTVPANGAYALITVRIEDAETKYFEKLTRDSFNDLGRLAPRTNLLVDNTILFLGDSITANYNDPYSIPYLVGQRTGAFVINGGIGGAKLSYYVQSSGTISTHQSGVRIIDSLISGDFEDQKQDAVDRYTGGTQTRILGALDRLQDASLRMDTVHYIVAAYGTNDYLQSRPAGAFDDDVATFRGALSYLIRQTMTNYPHIKLLLATGPFMVNQNFGEANLVGLKMSDYADMVIEAGKEFNVEVVDNYRAGINQFNKSYYFNSSDGIHGKDSTFIPTLANRIAGSLENM